MGVWEYDEPLEQLGSPVTGLAKASPAPSRRDLRPRLVPPQLSGTLSDRGHSVLSSQGIEPFLIRTMLPDEAAECEMVMRSLPGWFGIEESIQQYRRDLEIMETYVVETGGHIVGFMALNQHNQYSAEIHVMGVLEEFHRRGMGRSLVAHAVDVLHERSIEYLQVKTLGPSRESEAYAGTRRFYKAMGFRPLEETNLWGEGNPCLIMVRHLGCLPRGQITSA